MINRVWPQGPAPGAELWNGENMTTTMTAPARRRSLVRRGALGLSGAALMIGAGFAAAPAQAADTGIPALEAIKSCESGGNYSAVNASSGASGAYQFLDSTWQSMSAAAGYATAASAPESVQDAAAIELYNAQGTTPWAASESCWSGSVAGSTGTGTTATAATTAPSEVAADETTSASEDMTPEADQTVVTVQDVATAQPAVETSTSVPSDPAPAATATAGAPADPAIAGESAQMDQFVHGTQGGAEHSAQHGVDHGAQLAGAAC